MSAIWGITDGSAGMLSQVVGVAEALGGHFTLKKCIRRKPWVWLPAHWAYKNVCKQLESGSDALQPPWPDIVITSGRRSAAFALAIKRAHPETVTIHLTNPRIPTRYFDLVVPMAHDDLAGSNILPVRYALHKLTKEKLAKEAAKWQPVFAHLPKPWIAVLIGGSTNKYTLDDTAITDLIAQLKMNQAGSLLITVSRRTGEKGIQALKSAFAGKPNVYFYDGNGENPYLGLLALADTVMVTNDSVNMMSEAAYTGKPIYILPLKGHKNTKPARFAKVLIDDGIARICRGKLENWENKSADEREKVVAEIRRRAGFQYQGVSLDP